MTKHRGALLACALSALVVTCLSASADSARPSSGVPDGFFVSGSFDGVYASRTNVSGPMVVPTAGLGTLIDANDLKFSDKWGYDARLRAGVGMWSVEGRYLGGFRWDSRVGDMGAVGNFRLGSFSNFGATSLTANAASKLDSWEINLRAQVLPWFTPFIGYREFKI